MRESNSPKAVFSGALLNKNNLKNKINKNHLKKLLQAKINKS